MGATWSYDPDPVNAGLRSERWPERLAAAKMGHEEFVGLVGVMANTIGAGRFMFHYNPDSRRIRKKPPYSKGLPDLVIVGERGVMFAELKCRGDTISPEQTKWIAWLHVTGVRCSVWEPADLFNGRIERELAELCL